MTLHPHCTVPKTSTSKIQCQCTNIYDIIRRPSLSSLIIINHKGHPQNIITIRFSQAFTSLLTTANIILPTSNLDKETRPHLPTDPTACPFDVSHKPNIEIECHPSNVFSMIGYDITITNATTPLPTNQDPPSSLDCITKYTANADLSLLDYERNKLNQPNIAEQPLRFQVMTSLEISSTTK